MTVDYLLLTTDYQLLTTAVLLTTYCLQVELDKAASMLGFPFGGNAELQEY